MYSFLTSGVRSLPSSSSVAFTCIPFATRREISILLFAHVFRYFTRSGMNSVVPADRVLSGTIMASFFLPAAKSFRGALPIGESSEAVSASSRSRIGSSGLGSIFSIFASGGSSRFLTPLPYLNFMSLSFSSRF
ncbi:MAG: hypothetical protein QME66_03380 [Candidatus Eisenbacteria bacterium]|nr:hypothetical protein [Candidatus Eisenbacteria bacterium]